MIVMAPVDSEGASRKGLLGSLLSPRQVLRVDLSGLHDLPRINEDARGHRNPTRGTMQTTTEGETGAVTHVPPGVPAQVLQQISQISHTVFAYGFVDAMKATLYLPIAVLLVGAVATLLIQRRGATAGAAAWQPPGAAGAQTRATINEAADGGEDDQLGDEAAQTAAGAADL